MPGTNRARNLPLGPDGRGLGPAVGTLALALALAACGDAFANLLAPVPEEPGQATLVDFRTGGLSDPSAFDLISGRTVRVDQTASWDFLFYVTEGGQAQLRTFSAATDGGNHAGLQKVSRGFDDLTRAPSSGYVAEEPLPISVGDVVAAVTRQEPGVSIRCRHFAKLEVLAIDTEAETMRFRYLVNPNCEVRSVEAGASGQEQNR